METGENQGLDSGVSESGVSPGAGWVRRGGVGLAWRTRREAVRLHTVAASSSPRGEGAGRARGPVQAGGRRCGFISQMLEGVFQKQSFLTQV